MPTWHRNNSPVRQNKKTDTACVCRNVWVKSIAGLNRGHCWKKNHPLRTQVSIKTIGEESFEMDRTC